LTQDQLIESFAMRKRNFRAVSSREGTATRAAESGYRGLSTTAVTVVDAPFRDFARILRFHLANFGARRPCTALLGHRVRKWNARDVIARPITA